MLLLTKGLNKNFMVVPSDSDKQRKYRVYIDKVGVLRCNCPDNIFRQERFCKHIRRYVLREKV
jgi:hypothetical protein